MSVWATLECSHSLLWDDPDEDVDGRFWCPKCCLFSRVSGFHEDAGTG